MGKREMSGIARAALVVSVSMIIGYGIGLGSAIYSFVRSTPIRSSLLDRGREQRSKEMLRSAILNTLADRYGYRSYLEIGQGYREDNLDLVKCPIKIGVDPDAAVNASYQMTSDEFFEINNDMYDLIFIDGLHVADQAYRDILNSLEVLSENGTIVVHDCNPTEERHQTVPRPPYRVIWTGGVWKAWVRLRASRSDLKMYVVDIDFGCGVIRRGTQQTIIVPEALTYEEFDRNRKEWLNLVDVDVFLSDIRQGLPATKAGG